MSLRMFSLIEIVTTLRAALESRVVTLVFANKVIEKGLAKVSLLFSLNGKCKQSLVSKFDPKLKKH